MKNFIILFSIISINYSYSQNKKFLEQLKHYPKSITKQQIDSFLSVKQQQIPLDSLSYLYHFIGLKWSYKTKNIDDAILKTKTAILLRKQSDSINFNLLKQSFYNLAFYKTKKLDYYNAIKDYQEILHIGTNDSITAKAHRGLGVIYSKIGDFHKATYHFEESLKPDNAKLTKKHTLFRIHINSAQTYSLMGYAKYSEEIKKHLEKAQEIIEKHNANFDYKKLQINHIEGNRLFKLGHYLDALKTQHHSLEKILTLKNAKPNDISSIHNSLASSYTKLQQYSNAEKHLKKAIKYNNKYAAAYENLGDIYNLKKDFKKGLDFYQKAISLSTNNPKLTNYKTPLNETDLELATNKFYLLNHLTTKADGLIKYYQHDNNKNHLEIALQTFLSADKLVDIIRFESTEHQSKLFWREKSASLYMKAVEVCYLLNKPKDAYYFMERNKALLLLENITNEDAKSISKLPDSIAKREFELKQNIYLSENALHTLSSTHKDSLNHYKNLVFSAKQHYNSFVDSLELAFPDYGKMKRKTDILPYKTLKNNYCNNDYAVLQYILNDNQGYGLLSTNAKTLFFPLKHVNTLNNTLISFYKLLTKNETIPNKKEQLNQLSNTIFKTLIPKNIYNAINTKKLTIVPDYTLQQIPFETLCVNINKQRYLIEDVDIHYAYSMSYLKSKEHIKSSAKKNWLGYAPINFETHQLPKLAFSKTEITEANTLQNGKMVLSTNASKSKWLHQMPHYKINHLSTHADIDSTGNHWIAFSDEKLYINEIYATKNQSDMVVLSACNTSTGELKKGEGVMSLARGFFHSGAKSVVSSLWFADDKSSKDIIVDFYKELDKGQTKSAALRQAKLNYINAYRDTKISPSRWGALILIGDNSPIKHYVFSTTAIIAIVILVLIVIVFLLFKRKKG